MRSQIALFAIFLPFSTSIVRPPCQNGCSSSNSEETSNTGPQAQCPCVKAPGASQCLSFDSSLMAATLDEALEKFPNLATPEQKPLFPSSTSSASPQAASASTFTASRVQQTFAHDDSQCASAECRTCKENIANRFENGSSSSVNAKTSSSGGGWAACGGAPTQNNQQRQQPRAMDRTTQQIVQLLSSGKRRKRQNQNEIDNDTADNTTSNLIGVSTLIGCDYRRGTALTSTIKWSGLCNICWQWRKLPPDYFPTYLNEVSCDSGDSGCLAGFGRCRPVLRSVNILRNRGNDSAPRWEEAAINTVAACECQVEIGTPLHNLVAR